MNTPPLDDYANLMPFIDTWEREQAEFLGELLYNTLKPAYVVDWGCASGLYLVPFRERGCDVLGLDAEPTAGKLLPQDKFWRTDIRKPIVFMRGFPHIDLALCIETAEHIQEEYADQLVANVAHSADVVFWSAAHKGQGGQFHYNEQPPSYWVTKFVKRGFKLHPKLKEVDDAIKASAACQKVEWLIPNAMLLERAK